MKLLSSLEEILILTIMSLAENAYGVTIRRKLVEATKEDWSFGAIYDPLYRLEQKGLLKSTISDPTSERGGRSKRLFSVTEAGLSAIKDQQEIRKEFSIELADLNSAGA